MFGKDSFGFGVCKGKQILDRRLFEVRYLIKRGNYTGAYAPRVKTFSDYKKALTWAKKHCEIYVLTELIYDANCAEYFSIETIAFGVKK